MPAVKEVYRGAVSYASASGTDPAAIVIDNTTDAPLAQSYCAYTIRTADSEMRALRHIFTAKLAVNGSNLELSFSRNSASSAKDLTIEWTVTTFEASALNQDIIRGEVAASADPENIALGVIVDEAATMVATSFKTDQLSYIAGQTRYLVSLTTTTDARDTLTLDFSATPSTDDCTVAWQVIEFNTADIAIQHGSTNFSESGTASITSVTLADSLVMQTGNINGSGSGYTRFFTRIKLNSSTELGIDAQDIGTPTSQDVSWSVLEMLDAGRVEKGEVSIADAASTPSTAPSFTAMTLAQAQPMTAYCHPNNRSTSTTTDYQPGYLLTTQRVNATGDELTITRSLTNGPIEIGWSVVEWPLAGGGGPTVIEVGQLAETDLLQSVSRGKVRGAGLLQETEAVQSAARQKARTLNQITTSESMLPVGRTKIRTVGLLTETETALSVSSGGTLVGQLTEADTFQSVSAQKVKGVGLTAESDAMQAVAAQKARTVGVPTESDQMLPVARIKVRTVGLLTESDSMLPVSSPGTTVVGQLSETDQVLPVGRTKIRAVGILSESDSVHSVARHKVRSVALITETDSILGVAATTIIQQLVETDAMLPVRAIKTRVIGLLTDSESIFSVGRIKVKPSAILLETDQALAVTGVGGSLYGNVLRRNNERLRMPGVRNERVGLPGILNETLTER